MPGPTLRGKIDIDTTGVLAALRRSERALSAWVAGMRRQLRGVGRAWSDLGSSIGRVAAPLRKIMVWTAAAAASLSGAVIWQAAKFQDLRANMEAVTGSAERARRIWGEVFDLFLRSPMDLEPLLRVRTLMESVGISGRKAMQSVAEAASATGNNVMDVASGMVSMETEVLRRMGVLSKQANGTFEFEFSVKGGPKIKAFAGNLEEAREALINIYGMKFGGSLEKRVNTLTGAMSTFWGVLKAVASSIGTIAVGELTSQLQSLNNTLLKALDSERVAKFGQQFGKVVKAISAFSKALYDMVGGSDWAEKLGTAINFVTAKSIGLVKFVATAVAGTTNALSKLGMFLVLVYGGPVIASLGKLAWSLLLVGKTTLALLFSIAKMSRIVPFAVSAASVSVGGLGKGLGLLFGKARVLGSAAAHATQRKWARVLIAMRRFFKGGTTTAINAHALLMSAFKFIGSGLSALGKQFATFNGAIAAKTKITTALIKATWMATAAWAIAAAVGGYKFGKWLGKVIDQWIDLDYWLLVTGYRLQQLWGYATTFFTNMNRLATGQKTFWRSELAAINEYAAERIKIAKQISDAERGVVGGSDDTDADLAKFLTQMDKLQEGLKLDLSVDTSPAVAGIDDALAALDGPTTAGSKITYALDPASLVPKGEAEWRKTLQRILDSVASNTKATAANTAKTVLEGYSTGPLFSGIKATEGKAPPAVTQEMIDGSKKWLELAAPKVVEAIIGGARFVEGQIKASYERDQRKYMQGVVDDVFGKARTATSAIMGVLGKGVDWLSRPLPLTPGMSALDDPNTVWPGDERRFRGLPLGWEAKARGAAAVGVPGGVSGADILSGATGGLAGTDYGKATAAEMSKQTGLQEQISRGIGKLVTAANKAPLTISFA